MSYDRSKLAGATFNNHARTISGPCDVRRIFDRALKTLYSEKY